MSLSRKYRPQKFSELAGQNHIKITLQNEIQAGQIGHAYLFTGPRGIGKTTTARLLARALNCETKIVGNQQKTEIEPCGQCRSCLEIREGRSLDLIEIDAASHTGVDHVRDNIINNARVLPSSSPYKVFIIDEVHMLSAAAFAAMLKILEEPPSYVVFILATTEVHKVPYTIISRCQRFEFKKIGIADIISRLNLMTVKEGYTVEKSVLEMIALRSEGFLRDAESLLDQVLALGETTIGQKEAELIMPHSDTNLVLDFLQLLKLGNTKEAVTFLNKILEEGVDLIEFNSEILTILRQILLYKIQETASQDFLMTDPRITKRISQLAQDLSLKKIVFMIDIFTKRKQELKRAQIIQLPLELAVLEIADFSLPTESEKSKDENQSL